MCGIFGVVAVDEARLPGDEVLAAAARDLAHRGPDAAGHCRAPGAAFAHTRLALIDHVTSPTGIVLPLADLVKRLSAEHAGRDIVTIAHGGSIRAAVAHALGLEPERALALAVDNCSLTRLDHIAGAAGSHDDEGRDSWRVGRFNHGLGEIR